MDGTTRMPTVRQLRDYLSAYPEGTLVNLAEDLPEVFHHENDTRDGYIQLDRWVGEMVAEGGSR